MGRAILNVFMVTIRPGRYFRERDAAELMRNALTGVLPWILAGATLVFISALLNADAIRAVQMDFLRRMQVDPKLIPEATGLPFISLSFAMYWAVLIAILVFARYGFVRVLGEAERAFWPGLYVTMHAVLPMALIGAGIAVANNLFPPGLPESGTGPGSDATARLVVTAFLSGTGFVWEGFIATTGYRLLYAQNTGRAVLTFLFPWLLVGGVIVFLSR